MLRLGWLDTRLGPGWLWVAGKFVGWGVATRGAEHWLIFSPEQG